MQYFEQKATVFVNTRLYVRLHVCASLPTLVRYSIYPPPALLSVCEKYLPYTKPFLHCHPTADVFLQLLSHQLLTCLSNHPSVYFSHCLPVCIFLFIRIKSNTHTHTHTHTCSTHSHTHSHTHTNTGHFQHISLSVDILTT